MRFRSGLRELNFRRNEKLWDCETIEAGEWEVNRFPRVSQAVLTLSSLEASGEVTDSRTRSMSAPTSFSLVSIFS